MCVHRNGTAVLLTLLLCLAPLACGGGKQQPPQLPKDLTTQEKVRMAESMLRAGRMHEALEQLHEAVEEEPENARLHNHYGSICFRAGRYAEAAEAFEKALELDPYLTDARNYLGAVYNELGRPAEAETQWREALKDPAFPTPEKVFLNLGALYAQQGRDDEAIDTLRRAVEINPKYHHAHYELAKLLERVGKLDEAARLYEVASPDYRSDGQFHYRLGFTYFRLGEKAKAKESLYRVLAVSPGSPSAAQADELLKMIR
ncbi:MAG: tetratricopeptide repeat protein [bacterium]|nr:tetratricopeptide repeat protein [bacterium]